MVKTYIFSKILYKVISMDNANFQVCLPELGTLAPDFTATSTFGPINLSDYKGKWLVFFAHPNDFTPVCTTEFLAFAKSFKSFQDRNTELLGLSIDGIYSHLAWVNNIYEITGVEIPFPIIADADMSISKLYGLLTPDVSCCETVRATFIIDPNQFIRLILYYPFNIGRNIMEILRCIDALQFSAQEKLATPANWMPGLAGVMPPPKTYEGLKNRERSCGENCKCLDWYLCFKGNNLDVLE